MRTHGRTQIVAVVIAVAVGWGLGTLTGASPTQPVDASSPYFNGQWTSIPGIRRGTLGGLTGISASNFDTAAIAAGDAWDNVPNAWLGDSPNIGWAGSGTTPVGACSTASSGEILSGSAYLSTGTTSLASKCYSSGSNISKATVRLNANLAWSIGASSGKRDVQSSLTHELGHAMGWGGTHVSSACTGSSQNTMCSTTPIGVTWWRSLESIDGYEFDRHYD